MLCPASILFPLPSRFEEEYFYPPRDASPIYLRLTAIAEISIRALLTRAAA